MHIEKFTSPDGTTHARIMCDDYGEGHFETGECETDSYLCGGDIDVPDRCNSDEPISCRGCISELQEAGYGPNLEMLTERPRFNMISDQSFRDLARGLEPGR